jgi:phytanoyl-CoA hydroxylase
MNTQYETDGYVLVKGLFSTTEAEAIRDHFMEIHRTTGEYCEGGVDPTSDDPLRRFPRMMNPHRGDQVGLNYFLDARIREKLVEICGADPYAVQTMVYFKPAGSRGQALHQDQRYLHVRPGTCIAAWMALDRCDEENGCLQVVPGSHELPILCPIKSDYSTSFTHETVPVPAGKEVVNVIMDPGDVLFFHGNLIHGSDPNRTTDRFRRIIVGHYAVAEMEVIGRWYNDALTMDGQPIQLEGIDGDGPCGTFVTRDGEQLIDMSETLSAALAAH